MNKEILILTDDEKSQKAEMDKFLKLGEKTQRVLLGENRLNMIYSYIRIYEMEDKTIFSNCIAVMTKYSNKKAFIKRQNVRSITYKHKGASASRLTIWKGGSIFDRSTNSLIKFAIKYLNRDIDLSKISLLDIISNQKGIYSKIMAGKISTDLDFIEHICKYNLRAYSLKIKKENYGDIINLVKLFDDIHQVAKLIYCSENILDMFSIFKKNKSIIESRGKHTYMGIFSDLFKYDIKVDWSTTGIKLEVLRELVSEKESWTKEVLNLWNGGPTVCGPESTSKCKVVGLPL